MTHRSRVRRTRLVGRTTTPSPKTSSRGQADADDDAKDDGATADAPTRHPGDDEPEELLCPITKAMMRDPVFVAGSGNTYEREAIETFSGAVAAPAATR